MAKTRENIARGEDCDAQSSMDVEDVNDVEYYDTNNREEGNDDSVVVNND